MISRCPFSGLPVGPILPPMRVPQDSRRGSPQRNIGLGIDRTGISPSSGAGSQGGGVGRQGPAGPTGATGATGATGPAGPCPSGGTAVCNGDGSITITFTCG